jgi:hypothetical protein
MSRPLLISLLVLSSLLFISSLAGAKELGVHGGKASFMKVRGYAEKGVKLPAGVAGWYLEVDVPGDGAKCSAEMQDVSPTRSDFIPMAKWLEEVPNVGKSSTLTLDPSRYTGTHTYLVTLRCGLRQVSRSLVHLLNPTDEHLAQKFEMAQKPGADETEPSEIVTVPKSSL